MEKATIFIPDISGFTEFMSQTEIEHSAHIIIELLEVLIANNELGFYLSEVEGDALLFYRKGPAPSQEAMTQQCLKMFEAFHKRLQVIERDSICQCGACQTASNLSLKFIIHSGNIHEVKVAHFTKAAGVDMIIAHRLLKNQVPGDEYILFSDSFCRLSRPSNNDHLAWAENADAYPAIGAVAYRFCELAPIREQIPKPVPEESVDLEMVNSDKSSSVSVLINAPMSEVYQNLIDVEKRILWVSGMKKMERDNITERTGMKHVCFTSGFRLEHTILDTQFEDDQIKYFEKVKILGLLLEVIDCYHLSQKSTTETEVILTISITRNVLIPKFIFNNIVKGLKTDLNNLKELCETTKLVL